MRLRWVETCDDKLETKTCDKDCSAVMCGDGLLNMAAGEACDDGNMVDTDMCLPTCVAAKCGDGKVQAGVEACDDGNMVDTDACLATCVAAKCGDGKVQAGVEECDDGSVNANDGCSAVCKKEAASCLNNPKWTPVNCTTTKWVWSSDKVQAMTLAAANMKKVLWSGCTHAPAANTCSLDGKGWVSTQQYVMADCNATWYHIGGDFTGNCGGHDGDSVRRLALTQNDCYDY